MLKVKAASAIDPRQVRVLLSDDTAWIVPMSRYRDACDLAFSPDDVEASNYGVIDAATIAPRRRDMWTPDCGEPLHCAPMPVIQ